MQLVYVPGVVRHVVADLVILLMLFVAIGLIFQ